MSDRSAMHAAPQNRLIATRLRQVERRLRWQLAIRLASIGLSAGLALSIVLAAASRLVPVASAGQQLAASVVLILISVVAPAVVALIRRTNLLAVARLADRQAGLRERLSTALEFAGKEGESSLIIAQREDAARAAASLNATSVVPFSASRRELLVAFGLLVVLIGMAVLPNPMQGILHERAAAAKTIEEEKAKIEQVKREVLEKAESNPTEKQEELLRALDQLTEDLTSAPASREEALAEISAAEEKLTRLIDRNLPAERLGLDRLARGLQGMSDVDPNLDLGASADPGQLGEDVAALSKALDKLDPAQREAAADSLSATAGSLSTTNPALATQLAKGADALRAGEMSGAKSALSQAEGTLREMERRMADQDATARVLAQLQSSRGAIAGSASGSVLAQRNQGAGSGSGQSGQSGAQGQGNAGGQSGSSAGGGQGSSSGQGTGGSMNPGTGSGAPSGSGPIAGTNAPTSPGATSPSTGQPATGRPGTTGVGAYEPVFSPGGVDAEGKPLFLPGVPDAGEKESQWIATQPGAGTSLVPYSQVYEAYSAAAARSLDSGSVPVNLRDYVRGYFTSLEPKAGE